MGTLYNHVGVRTNTADLVSNMQSVNSLEPLNILSVYVQLYTSFTWTFPKGVAPGAVSALLWLLEAVSLGLWGDRPQNNCVTEVTTDHTVQALLISMGQSCLQLV